MDLLDTQIFSIISQDGFARLAAAFYRQIPADEILDPMAVFNYQESTCQD